MSKPMKREQVLYSMKPYIMGNRKLVAGIVVANALAVCYGVINPKLFELLIDKVFYQQLKGWFLIIVLLLIGIYAMRFLSDWLNVYCENRFHKETLSRMRKDLFRRIMDLEECELEKKDIGEWKMRIADDVEVFKEFLSNQVGGYYFSFFTAIVYFVLLCRIHVLLALGSIVFVPLIYVTERLVGKKQGEVIEAIRKTDSTYYAFEYQIFQNWLEIRVNQEDRQVIKGYKKLWEKKKRLSMAKMKYWCMNECLTELKGNYLNKVFPYLLAVPLLYQSTLKIGTVVMFSLYFAEFYKKIEYILKSKVDFVRYSGIYERTLELLEKDEKDRVITEETVGKKLGDVEKITCENLSFCYTPGNYVLSGLDICFEKGNWYFICGESGCGKSTLIKLLAKLLEAKEGEIKIDGVEIKKMKRAGWYQCTGIVLQNVFIFQGSIKENILMGHLYDSDWMNYIIKIVQLEKLIRRVGGIDYCLMENGSNISQGERQRIALARELYKKPSILIMDETMSGVDQATEQKILSRLKKEAWLQTLIYVTHRKSFIGMADRLLEIKKEATYEN